MSFPKKGNGNNVKTSTLIYQVAYQARLHGPVLSPQSPDGAVRNTPEKARIGKTQRVLRAAGTKPALQATLARTAPLIGDASWSAL